MNQSVSESEVFLFLADLIEALSTICKDEANDMVIAAELHLTFKLVPVKASHLS